MSQVLDKVFNFSTVLNLTQELDIPCVSRRSPVPVSTSNAHCLHATTHTHTGWWTQLYRRTFHLPVPVWYSAEWGKRRAFFSTSFGIADEVCICGVVVLLAYVCVFYENLYRTENDENRSCAWCLLYIHHACTGNTWHFIIHQAID